MPVSEAMTVSPVIFVLVIIFGSSSWMGTNALWMQLPLLTASLPEGWNLPSYMAAIVQIACIAPLIYAVVHKGCKQFTIPTTSLITFFLILACICQFGLVFFWDDTATIGTKHYSLALYLLLFGLAIVNAISNVLFMPFMAQFHPSYLNAYFVGMGFSALVPSILSLIQGTSNYDCVASADGTMQPQYFLPRFSVAIFFLIVFIWTIMATICFIVLYKDGAHKRAKEDEVHEGSPLNNLSRNQSFEMIPSAVSPVEEVTKESASPPSEKDTLHGFSYIIVLLATALVNAQMNGVIPSIQSYASLPYSQDTYHYGLTLANVVSPLASFIPLFLTIRSLTFLTVLTIASSLVTGFMIYLAALSPNLIFNSETVGSALSITSALVAAGLHSYLRVVFATLLREGKQSESRLFWCGVFIQIGSFIGSAVMFPLVNILSLFTSAPACRS